MSERSKFDPEIVQAYEETGMLWLPVDNVERQEGFAAGWRARADTAAERERRLVERAWREGYEDGVSDYSAQEGGWSIADKEDAWKNSSAKKSLTQHKEQSAAQDCRQFDSDIEYIRADLAAERKSRLASAEDIHALADRLHESGLHKASVHARSLAHELERQPSETP